MNGVYIEADSIGKKFYFQFSLMEYDGLPIVFVLRDQNDDIYLCYCTEFSDFQKWVIAKTDTEVLTSVANQEISIYKALGSLEQDIILAEYDHEEEMFSSAIVAFNKTPENRLPEKEKTLRNISEEIREKISLLEIYKALTEYPSTLDKNKEI